MAVYGMPAQAPQGWGNWQQGPGQVPMQHPFQQGAGQAGGGIGAGAAFRAANPMSGMTPSGTGGGGPPPNMMPTPGSGNDAAVGGNAAWQTGTGTMNPQTLGGTSGGDMNSLMQLLMGHPAIQNMLRGLPGGGYGMAGAGSGMAGPMGGSGAGTGGGVAAGGTPGGSMTNLMPAGPNYGPSTPSTLGSMAGGTMSGAPGMYGSPMTAYPMR